MKEKTLEDFKKSFAQDKGFEDWERFCFSLIQGTHSNMGSITIVEVYLDIIAEKHANHVKAIALQEGFAKGCKDQKIVCAEHAEIELPEEYGEEYIYPVDKDSILNAPDAVNPFVAGKKYPIGGFAPGNYTNTCVTCKNEFIGDKLARQCEPCAIKMTK